MIGRKEGRKEGMEEGRKERRKEGRKEGREEGREEGRKERRTERRKQGSGKENWDRGKNRDSFTVQIFYFDFYETEITMRSTLVRASSNGKFLFRMCCF